MTDKKLKPLMITLEIRCYLFDKTFVLEIINQLQEREFHKRCIGLQCHWNVNRLTAARKSVGSEIIISIMKLFIIYYLHRFLSCKVTRLSCKPNLLFVISSFIFEMKDSMNLDRFLSQHVPP